MPNAEAFIHLTRSYWSLLVNFSLNIVSLTGKLLHFEVKFCSILVIVKTTLLNFQLSEWDFSVMYSRSTFCPLPTFIPPKAGQRFTGPSGVNSKIF